MSETKIHPYFTNFLLLEEDLTTHNIIFSLKGSMKGYSNYQTKNMYFSHFYLLNPVVLTIVIGWDFKTQYGQLRKVRCFLSPHKVVQLFKI